MTRRVTATEAARKLSELLDRVRDDRETFVILRGDEEVGQLAPIHPGEPITLRGLFEILEGTERPDTQFADDLEDIQRSQPPADRSPWSS